jgi:hypothetical protein
MRTSVTTAMLLALLCAGLNAYVFLGTTLADGATVMHLQAGSSPLNLIDGTTSWNQSAEAALGTWNPYLGRVQFRVVRDSTSPTGDGNQINNVFWSSSIYGRSFDSALAVTTHWRRGTTRTEGDVIFNTDYSWNSYTGPLRRGAGGDRLYDFRRVALHEFGHVLGLNHPDQAGQSVASIMHSSTSDIDRLQADDIAGVGVLYGGTGQPQPTAAPGPPSGLSATAVANFVTLSWRAPSVGTPSSYIIEAGSVPGAANLANVATGTTATVFNASGVGAGIYYVRVKAANAAGVSAASNESTLVVGGSCSSAPAAPTGLAASTTGSTVRLAWQPAGGNPTTYIVEAGSAPGLANLANSDLGGPTPAYTATGVGRGIYYVRMRARNACGVGPVSNEIVVVVQ